jgi:hypothetical protein
MDRKMKKIYNLTMNWKKQLAQAWKEMSWMMKLLETLNIYRSELTFGTLVKADSSGFRW